MRKISCLLTTTVLISSYSFVTHAENITLRADTWCPYNCEPKDARPGYMIEIAKAALEPAGHKVEYETLNWARAIADSRAGKFSGIVGAAKSDAPDFIFPETSLGTSKNCFFAKADATWSFKDKSSLETASIGVIKDYTYGDEVDDYIKSNAKNAKNAKKVDVVSGDNPLELNIKKVQMGRVTSLLESEAVLKNYMYVNKLADSSFKNAGCLKDSDDLFIAFSPKHPKAKEFAKLVGDKVVAMRKDGSLKKMLEQYGINDWGK
ncbi:MAG: transporter substrate-binding domain-containing protein [Oligoflexales bacterium]|nr:transporter substrate-binding domain-containing protein [Oligoflexales bacterium]